MPTRSLIEGLFKINCKYLNEPDKKGKCYSKDCMMNQDKGIAADIQKNGCIIWSKFTKGDAGKGEA